MSLNFTEKFIKIKIYILLIFFISPSFILANETNIYSFKNIEIYMEDDNSFIAKENGIKNAIFEKFESLLKNLSVNPIDINLEKFNPEDYLKNLVIKNEIITEKKYIALIDIYFDKEKVINLYKNENILFSDTISPTFLILSSHNFDGTDILWEKNNWNFFWSNLDNNIHQLNIKTPELNNKNKILLSSEDIYNLNLINIDNILNYYDLNQTILITATKKYYSDNGQIYIDLLITSYNKEDKSLENIYSKNILIEELKSEEILSQLTLSSYDEIFKWWKSKTITYFNQLNQITCFMEINNIKSLNKIKDILNSISHVDRIYLESLNSEDIKLKIFYYGKMQEIINIFDLSNISIIEQNNKCIIKNESI